MDTNDKIKTIENSFKEVHDSIDKVEHFEDEIESALSNLNMILVNLMIEAAKIHEPNGIEPISKTLNNVIGVIKEHSDELNVEFKLKLSNNINTIEKLLNDMKPKEGNDDK